MTTKKKILIAAVVAVAISSTVAYSIVARNRGVVGVQSGRVVRQDLTQTVSANGEIKPKKYVNVSSNMMGRIVRMPVKEGDHVKDGDLLVQLESIQTEADVKAAAPRVAAGMGDSLHSSSRPAAILLSNGVNRRATARDNRAKRQP